MTETNRDGQPVKYKRHLRNYLIDRRFQLKYTSMIMILSLTLIVALGVLLYLQVLATVKENAVAVKMSAEAARVSADAAKVSEENAEIVIAQALSDDYFKNPEITKKFVADMKKPAQEVAAQAQLMDEQARNMEGKSADFEKRAHQLPLLVLAFGLTFLFFLFLLSIFITHRISGPVYKISKLMSEVDGDSLHVDGALRTGDEMWNLFKAFNSMIERLRKHQSTEATRIGELLDALEHAKDGEGRKKLIDEIRGFREKMMKALD